jgi:hypothetical protein
MCACILVSFYMGEIIDLVRVFFVLFVFGAIISNQTKMVSPTFVPFIYGKRRIN